MSQVKYGSWKLAAPLAVILAATGLLTGSIEFFIAAIIPSIMLMASYLSRTPKAENLEIERVIENEAPSPGQEVEVKLKVRNNGDTTFTDLRIIDSVPEELKVTKGSPRASIALSPGNEKQLTYTLVARRGSYVFREVKTEVRGGGNQAEIKNIEALGDDHIECKTELEEIILRDKTDEQIGDIVTSRGGSGIEFHSLRDYKNSDPLSRVEWKHMAKTGDLATKNFREERSGDIVLVIDAREISNRKAEKGHPTGTDLSAYAAKRAYKALLKSRHRPGIAVLGVDNSELSVTTDSSLIPYIKPGRSREKRRKVEKVLKEVQKADKKNEVDLKSKMYKLLPPNAQIVFFTPLLDDQLTSAVKILDRHGYPAIIMSPDITYGDSPAARLEKIKRDIRLKNVRSFAPVVDWDIRRPMSIQVSKALKRIYARDI